MKKWMSLLIVGALVAALLAGCGATTATEPNSSIPQPDAVSDSVPSMPQDSNPQTGATQDDTSVASGVGSVTQTKAPTTTTGKNNKPTTTTAKPTNTQKPTTATAAAKDKLNVVAIAGPTGVGMASLMKSNQLGTATNEYKFTLVNDPQQAVAAISNGTADIAAVPTNLASTLYKKTGGKVQILAVNTLGVLHILENGNTIQSVKDLRGKTIFTSGQGSNPEYILRYVLEKNGLKPGEDVTIQFVADNDALTAAVVTGQAEVAMVPEPKVTACRMQMNSAGKTPARLALDMTAEWEKVAAGESQLMMGCVIARKEVVEKNAAAVRAFLKEYEISIRVAISNVDTAAQFCEEFEVIPKKAIAQQAIPNCNLTFATGKTMKKQLSGYLKVLYDYAPSAIGGALPGEDFYYEG